MFTDEQILLNDIADRISKSFRVGLVVGTIVGLIAGLILGCVWTTPASAEPRVYKLDLVWAEITHNRDPMVPDIPHQEWGSAVAFEGGVAVGWMFFEPRLHFESAYGKVAAVGLHFITGFQVNDYFAFEYEHDSRHAADRGTNFMSDTEQYPLFNSFGLRVSAIPGLRRQNSHSGR